MSNRLDTFNDGIPRRVFIFDNRGKVWGCNRKNGQAGFLANIFCTTADITQPSEISEPKIDYTFTEPDEFANKADFDTELSIIDLEGLEDVEMVTTIGNTKINIRFLSLCGQVDVTAEMAAIAEDGDCWLKNGLSMGDTVAPKLENGIFKVNKSEFSGGSTLMLATPNILFQNGLAFKECQSVFTYPAATT